MKKNLFVVGLAVVVFFTFYFLSGNPRVGDELAGAGLPDAASEYDQIASRSTKAVIKADKGRVFAVRIENDSATTKFFQLYDRTTVPGSSSTPVLSVAIPPASATASPSVTTLDSSFFSPAIRFSTGITWAISPNFATYASTSNPLKHSITILYE